MDGWRQWKKERGQIFVVLKGPASFLTHKSHCYLTYYGYSLTHSLLTVFLDDDDDETLLKTWEYSQDNSNGIIEYFFKLLWPAGQVSLKNSLSLSLVKSLKLWWCVNVHFCTVNPFVFRSVWKQIVRRRCTALHVYSLIKAIDIFFFSVNGQSFWRELSVAFLIVINIVVIVIIINVFSSDRLL